MADFSEDESDPEMAEDLEEDVPELEELFESEESEENATLIGPAEDEAQGEALFDLEVEPATLNFDPYDHPTMPYIICIAESGTIKAKQSRDICFKCRKTACTIHCEKVCSVCLQDLPL